MSGPGLLGLAHTHGPACVVEHADLTAPAAPGGGVTSDLLADHTTFRTGGPADRIEQATTEADLIRLVQEADRAGTPLLILGGGSNVLVADDGFPGTVVLVATKGLAVDQSACAGAYVTAAAGEVWDDLVATSVERQWVGLETLSGIPGLAGSTPVQNAGAYGSEAAETIARVRTFDRHTGQTKTFMPGDCGFGYRTSRFKREPGRYVILSVDFQLRLGPRSEPIRYAELAARLGIGPGDRAPLAEVRAAVLELRRGKGMVLDAADHDTWSAGSFFTNPVLTHAESDGLPEAAPRYLQPDGSVKTSAAWLIAQAGFAKGFGDGPARLSSKHVLALTNAGGATTADLLQLARRVRDGVKEQFGVTLEPEPTLVNCAL
jgi:UDP-N-acetylmuramate dehydrogenase